jgi:hypothetical protein
LKAAAEKDMKEALLFELQLANISLPKVKSWFIYIFIPLILFFILPLKKDYHFIYK